MLGRSELSILTSSTLCASFVGVVVCNNRRNNGSNLHIDIHANLSVPSSDRGVARSENWGEKYGDSSRDVYRSSPLWVNYGELAGRTQPPLSAFWASGFGPRCWPGSQYSHSPFLTIHTLTVWQKWVGHVMSTEPCTTLRRPWQWECFVCAART